MPNIDVLLVANDPDWGDRMDAVLSSAGVRSVALPGVDAALTALAADAQDNPAVVLSDLVVPRRNGRGVLGGLQLLRDAAELDLSENVFLAFDAAHADAQSWCDMLGAAGVLHKQVFGDDDAVLEWLAPVLNHVSARWAATGFVPALAAESAQEPSAEAPVVAGEPAQESPANAPVVVAEPAQAPSAEAPAFAAEPADAEPAQDAPVVAAEPAQEPLVLTEDAPAAEPAQESPANAPVVTAEPAEEPPAEAPVVAAEPAQEQLAEAPVAWGAEAPVVAVEPAQEPSADAPVVAAEPAQEPSAEAPVFATESADAPVVAAEPVLTEDAPSAEPAQEPSAEAPVFAAEPAQEPPAEAPVVAAEPAQEPPAEAPVVAGEPAQEPSAEAPVFAAESALEQPAEAPVGTAEPAQEPSAEAPAFAAESAQEPSVEAPVAWGAAVPAPAAEPADAEPAQEPAVEAAVVAAASAQEPSVEAPVAWGAEVPAPAAEPADAEPAQEPSGDAPVLTAASIAAPAADAAEPTLDLSPDAGVAVEPATAGEVSLADILTGGGSLAAPIETEAVAVRAAPVETVPAGEVPAAPFAPPALDGEGMVDLVATFKADLGGDVSGWVAADQVGSSAAFDAEALRDHLAELADPQYDEAVPLAVLRVASHFFHRGALFLIDRVSHSLEGSGAFGIEGDAGRRVRAIRLPSDDPSVLMKAMEAPRSVVTTPDDSPNTQVLLTILGGPRPEKAFVGALRSGRGVEGVLYADSAIAPLELPNMAMLDIFLQQSGQALAHFALKQQLKAIQDPD